MHSLDCTGILVRLMLALSALEPWYRIVGISGHHLLNSATQFVSVDSGAMTMNGPKTLRVRMWASKPMVWTWPPQAHMSLRWIVNVSLTAEPETHICAAQPFRGPAAAYESS